MKQRVSRGRIGAAKGTRITRFAVVLASLAVLVLVAFPRARTEWVYRSATRGDIGSVARLDQMRTPTSDYDLETLAIGPSVPEPIRSEAFRFMTARDQTETSVCWDLDQGSGGLDARGTEMLMNALALRGDTVTRECIQILLHRLIAFGDQADPSLSRKLEFLSTADRAQATVLRQNEDKVMGILRGTYGLGNAYPNPESYQVIAGLHLAGTCPLLQQSIHTMRSVSSPFLNQYSELERELCSPKRTKF
jgi:hypothetical protein